MFQDGGLGMPLVVAGPLAVEYVEPGRGFRNQLDSWLMTDERRTKERETEYKATTT